MVLINKLKSSFPPAFAVNYHCSQFTNQPFFFPFAFPQSPFITTVGEAIASI